MRLLALDPGKVVGWASFVDGRLDALGVFDDSAGSVFRDVVIFHRPDACVIEIPRVYPVKLWKGDPNDLIKVAVTAGILMGILFEHAPGVANRIECITPHAWKGTRPKKIDHDLTWKVLAEGEREILTRELKSIGRTRAEHALDAIGMGLWKLDRR